MFKTFLASLLLLTFGGAVMAKAEKKLLIVVSSENKITLKNDVKHTTGFFLRN